MRYLPKWSTPRYLEAEVLQLPQKVRAVLVKYLLQAICILAYLCTDCGTQKIYLCVKDNRLSFSRVSLKSRTTDARVHKQRFSSACEMYVFRKTKIRRQTVKDEQIYIQY